MTSTTPATSARPDPLQMSAIHPRPTLAIALVAFLLSLPLAPAGARPDRRAWRQLLAGFQARGVTVLTSHPRCRQPNLDGLYVRGRTEVVVCQRGEPSTTLRHEGWHLVQHLCLEGRPWLAPETVEARLSPHDREVLYQLVSMERWPREAEARVMAQQPPASYFKAMDQACGSRLPFGKTAA